MADVSVPNTFVDGGDAQAAEVNGNFAALVAWCNSEAVRRDGTKSFTARQKGVAGVDPTDFVTKQQLDAVSAAGEATGVIKMFGGSAAPSGYLMCSGQAVSRTTYSALFAVIGTTYGAGDGLNTFNVPDFNGRVPMGAGTGASLTPRARGEKPGAEGYNTTTETYGSGGIGYLGGTSTHTHAAATVQPSLVVNFIVKT